MRALISIILVCCLVGPTGPAAADLSIAAAAEAGPLEVRNQFAPHLGFLTPVPRGPQALAQGAWTLDLALDYNSVFFAEHSDRWSVLVDMEMAVVNLGLRYGLTERLTMGIGQPAARMADGFLDGPLADFHDGLGLPNYDKDTRPENDFAYHVRKDGEDWFRAAPHGWHLMDTTLEAEWRVAGGQQRAMSLVYQLQLPTGETHSGFGNGAIDHGFMVPLRFCPSGFIFFLTPGIFLPGSPTGTDARIHTRPVAHLLAGLRRHLSPRLSLAAQVNYYSSPLEETGIAKLDDGSLELGLGFDLRLGEDLTLEGAFCEDLTRAAPDFNLHLALRLAVD